MPQTKLQRVRSTLAVIMAILIPIFLMLSVLLLFPLLIFYVPWMIYDWHTPERGGRSSKWLRGRTLWEYMRDYFPYTLLKTTDLPADRHYIFGVHPHGGAPVGLFLNFCTEATGFSKLFPGITPHATSLIGNYRFPIGRDINLLFGSCSVSSKSIDYLLSSPLTREELANGAKAHRTIGSQAVVIAIGGQHEMLDAHPGSFRLTLRDRRGFARKALQHGADLVPVFQFGENDLYNQVANPVGSRMRRLQIAMGDFPMVRGVCGLPIPFARPVTTVVGPPLHVDRCEQPTREQVDALHAEYCKCLVELFEKHKANFGIPLETHLEIAGFD